MDPYFLAYASLEQQRWMVSDKSRTDSFAKAIAETVKPGDVVIDVGAGTGLLSLFAAQAGARRVIAVEQSDMAHHARSLIAYNGFSDQIEVVHGAAEELALDEEADVIVSEWLGHLAYVERMFHSVISVRDAFLKPKGLMLPAAVDVLLAPVDDDHLYHAQGPGFWQKESIHGIDFSNFTDKELLMGYINKRRLSKNVLLAQGQALSHLNTRSAKVGEEWCSGTLEFETERDGVFNGFVGWFSARLSPKVILDTGPHCPPTHWEQTYFPFYPMQVRAGQPLVVDFQLDEHSETSRLVDLVLRMGEEEVRYVVA